MNSHNGAAITSDNFTLYVALIAACLACVGYLVVALLRRGGEESRIASIARACYYVSFASIAAASLYLMQCILSGNRYDIAYISENSSASDALLYKISSFWAGQGGSLLLWALIGGVIGVMLLRKIAKTCPALMSFWCLVQTFFLVLMVVDDPLKKLVDFQSGAMGAGLNPLLKNPWMAIHPPVIFMGYALLIVPAAFVVQALIEGDATRWARKCLPWALSGWVAMTAGLVLGMIWSYEVLGWGGYWSWDPVENASLIPWLLGTALVHGLVLQRQRPSLARWNVALAFGTFLSVMYATFLTRSGILSDVSVHSFGKTPAYGWLIGFPVFFGTLCLGLFLARVWVLKVEKKTSTNLRDTALSFGIIALCLFAAVVLIGTTYTTFNGGKDLNSSFYTHMSIPLSIAMLVLIALASIGNAAWKSSLKRCGACVAHAGVALVIIGIVFSTNGRSKVIDLVSGGRPREAFGYSFTYNGLNQMASGKQTIRVTAEQNGHRFDVPLAFASTPSGTLFYPYVRSSFTRDLYVSPDKIIADSITPTITMTDKGWVAHPVKVPHSDATLTVAGMQVESRSAKMEYSKPGAKPIRFDLADGHPQTLDGYTFIFKNFWSDGSKNMMSMTAGVDVGLKGRGFTDVAVIRVATKPLISLLWLGTVLIMLGGALAIVRRRSEKIT